MDIAEYWLYPCSFNETSCITAMEMLQSEVICLYYPIAGLTDTLGKYGIQVKYGNEIDTIVNLTIEDKRRIRKEGKEYSMSCSWENRVKEWKSMIFKIKKRILFYATMDFPKIVLEDYINSLNTIYHIDYTTKITNYNYDELIFVHEVFDDSVFGKFKEINYLNTEPLNLDPRWWYVKNNVHAVYKGLIYYDYSLSNIKIMNDNGITNTVYFPYLFNETENKTLKKLNEESEKIYDYGIICSAGTLTNDINLLKPPRRKKVVEHLLSEGFKVNIISGFGLERDIELSKCRTILNIHGSYIDEPSMIFEHIRCDRLLMAGYSILSESCIHFPKKLEYPKLTFMDYNSFFKIKKCYCFIHSCNIGSLKRLNHLLKNIPKLFETVFINNIGNTLGPFNNPKIKVIEYSSDPTLYEIPTLNRIQQFCQDNHHNVNVLYIHTKGVSYPDDYQEESDWIDMMLHFLYDPKCLYLLNEYETLGCNYTTDGFNYSPEGYVTTRAPPHYSGNFWWAQSEYLKKLKKIPETDVNKNDGEYWLMKGNPKYHELHHSGINHFKHRYTPEKYI